MRKSIKRLSLLAALALLLALCLLATAGPATAGTPRGAPSFTWYGGLAGQLDPGVYHFDCPAVGNTTFTDWRFYTWTQVSLPGAIEEQSWSTLYDWNAVLLDKVNPDDPESPIPGWHYHWGTGVISTTLDPTSGWPSMPPKKTWLWTAKLTGVTTPAGVHYITECWTGCNKYRGLRAYCTWEMRDPDFQDAAGKVWVLH